MFCSQANILLDALQDNNVNLKEFSLGLPLFYDSLASSVDDRLVFSDTIDTFWKLFIDPDSASLHNLAIMQKRPLKLRGFTFQGFDTYQQTVANVFTAE